MAFIPLMFENFWSPSCPRRSRYSSRRFRNRPCRTENVSPHLVNSIAEDIANSIAIALAMFGPDVPNDNAESSVLQQSRSSVTVDKDKYQANFDVQHFKPEEITVKVTGDHTVTIEAKHEEKPDEHGQIFRHFRRTYVLPESCDMERLESRLSSDGVLSIIAPTVSQQGVEHRTIPIMQTREPVRSVEENKSESTTPKEDE